MLNLEAEGVVHLGSKDIASKCGFTPGTKGNVLVHNVGSTDSESQPIELLLTGVFEIDPQNFFTSDGRFNSSNPYATSLEKTNAHCRLLPVHSHSEFSFSSDDFPTSIVSNIEAIEKMCPNPNEHEDTSIIVRNEGSPIGIKLYHRLFSVCNPSSLKTFAHSSPGKKRR